MKAEKKIPKSPEAWLKEIASAYLDALETLPFGKLTDNKFEEKDLFHLASALCVKYRGMKSSNQNLKKATDAALSSYVATEETVGDLFKIPQMAFAYCYLASHFGLDLVNTTTLSKIMGYIEENLHNFIDKTSGS